LLKTLGNIDDFVSKNIIIGKSWYNNFGNLLSIYPEQVAKILYP
jgi:hypothetical protein